MKQRLVRFVKLLAFPAFYLVCLALFGYLTFPYGRLKDRVIAELEKRGKPGQRIEIGKLGPYWFTGIEVSGLKIHLPPDEPHHSVLGDASASAAPSKETVIVVDEAHARVRMLPLLLGRVRVDFWASAFGGEVKGSAPVGNGKGEVELTIDHVDLSRVDLLAAAKIPVKGILGGKLSLEAPEGKFNKASGTLELAINDLVVSDGTTKIRDMIVLPPARLGDLTMSAEAKDGVLKINKLAAGGTDLEIAGDGRITLREPWSEATADLYARFRFTDSYRGKNELTKGLLGTPGSKVQGSIDFIPDMKAAKRADGFYGWKISGPLKKLRFDPHQADGPSGPTSTTSTAPAMRHPMGKGADGPRRHFPSEGGMQATPGVERPMPVDPGEGRAARNPAAPLQLHLPSQPSSPPAEAAPPPPPAPAPPAPQEVGPHEGAPHEEGAPPP